MGNKHNNKERWAKKTITIKKGGQKTVITQKGGQKTIITKKGGQKTMITDLLQIIWLGTPC